MMKKAKILKLLKRYAVITFGCMIYSIGIAFFLDPNNIVTGGVTGIAIILSHVIGSESWLFDTGTLIIMLNIPLFVIGGIFFGWKFILSTMYSTVVSSLFIELWNFTLVERIHITNDLMLSGIWGGVLFGLGLGLIFRMGSTTGGTDIIVKILRKKFRYIRMGVFSMSIDTVIVAVSAIAFRDLELACYTVLSIAIMTFSFDWMLYGGDSAKLVYIITAEETATEMSERILKELDVGATFVDAQGAFTGTGKKMILCAIKNILYPKLRDVVREVDPKAFTIVTSAKEIYGEGYKNPHDDEL